jgi:hypothetical protein
MPSAAQRPAAIRAPRCAKVLGFVWLPIMLIGDATEQVGFAIAGMVFLLTALTLALIGLT